jgi:hypothetical protein
MPLMLTSMSATSIRIASTRFEELLPQAAQMRGSVGPAGTVHGIARHLREIGQRRGVLGNRDRLLSHQ